MTIWSILCDIFMYMLCSVCNCIPYFLDVLLLRSVDITLLFCRSFALAYAWVGCIDAHTPKTSVFAVYVCRAALAEIISLCEHTRVFCNLLLSFVVYMHSVSAYA